MQFRILPGALALLALTTMIFAQEGNTYFLYPGDWDCPSHSPLTFGGCWTGTPIPNGTTITVFIDRGEGFVECYTFEMNAQDICYPSEDGGYFTQWYPCMANNGDQLYVQVQYEGCTYTSGVFTMSGAPQPSMFPLYEDDWTCQCENPGCEVKDEQSEALGRAKSKGSSGSSGTTP